MRGSFKLQAILFACIFLLLFNVLPANAVPKAGAGSLKSEFERARVPYRELLRSDPEVKNLVEWEKAASALLNFTKQFESDKVYRPRALYLLGRLYEHTYDKRQFRTGLSRAVYFYEVLAKEYRGNDIADDALLSLGDLRRSVLGDEPGARAAYYEIVDVYPRGDQFSEAKKRLGTGSGAEIAPLDEVGSLGSLEAAGKSAANTVVEEAGPVQAGKADPKVDSPERDKAPEIAILPNVIADLEESVRSPVDGKEVFSRELTKSRPTIVIDPGHGGKEEGAHGVDGVMEKDVVLQISLFLEELLRERLRAKTILTRTVDIDLPLSERTRIANDNDADLFVSVHANASDFKTAKGVETYYLDNTNDKSSLKLAERENASLLNAGGDDLSFIVSDLIQNAKLDDSIALAHNVQDAIVETLGRYYEGVKDLGVKRAPFFVLVGAHMPCVLVEVSFIDHPVEGQRLASKRYQKLIANALYEGIRDYYAKISEQELNAKQP